MATEAWHQRELRQFLGARHVDRPERRLREHNLRSYGRPYQTTIPDGAVTAYTYTYYNPWPTPARTRKRRPSTAAGRPPRSMASGEHPGAERNAARSFPRADAVRAVRLLAAGKMSAVSQPYAPGGTVYWTTYTHDGSGRTITVTAPDGASTTTYSYQGNSTTVTDRPANGRLPRWTLTARDPGDRAESRRRDVHDELHLHALQPTHGVSMTRGSVTQTRTFVYNGSDMTNATNPENGTVTYVYDIPPRHQPHRRSVEDGVHLRFLRPPERGAVLSPRQQHEDTTQRVTYYYDGTFPQAYRAQLSQRRQPVLDGKAERGSLRRRHHRRISRFYCYQYAYSSLAGGHAADDVAAPNTYYNSVNFTASYRWDDEGRMTSLQYRR